MTEEKKIICWHDTKNIVDEMNKNYPVYKKMMDTEPHIQVFKQHIQHILSVETTKQTVIDIGCGTAQISILFDKQYFDYEGCDLTHILQYCAQQWHPENIYLLFNAEISHYYFLKNYDIVTVNAFIDVMEYPLAILEKILSNAKKYVILHRQEISALKPTQSFLNPSYGSFTQHSIINKADFFSMLNRYNFEIVHQNQCGFGNWENGGDSFLLKKLE